MASCSEKSGAARSAGHIVLLLLVVAACAGCDQATKAVVKAQLTTSGPVTLFHHTVTLMYTENPGAFLSLGAELPAGVRFALFTVAVGLVLSCALASLLWCRAWGLWQRCGLALIVGGGVGNLIDRIGNHGYVVDFLRVSIGPWHTGVFNGADAAITAGVIIFALGSLWATSRQQHPTARA